MKVRQTTLAVGCGFFLMACANLAPNYQQPEVALSDRWIDESLQQSTQAKAVRNLGWKEYFLDLRLQYLITTALENNHDLKKAALSVELAEQRHGITQANRLPLLGSSGNFTRQYKRGLIGERYQVGLGISNFELDFFGRVKNQSEAALNQYLQTREARDAAQLSIINAVAKTYFQWRVMSALRDLSQKTLESREKSLELVALRFKEGLSSGTDVTTAQTLIATAKSSYEKQTRKVKQAENALSILVGVPVNQLALPKGSGLLQQFPSTPLYADTPSKVLFERPDIRQAEYGLKAANANIGAARALMYPSVTLTGNLGYASAEFSDLFKSGSRLWSFAPSISLPIFDAGKRKANIKMTKLQQKMAIEDYQSTVQAAFRDVSNALVARETLGKQYQAELEGLEATESTLNMVKLQVQEGLANGLNLLDAERADFASRQGLLATLLQTLTNRVDLYTAMGGGLKASSVVEQ